MQTLQVPQSISDNIFNNLPTISVPAKAELDDELMRYLATPTEKTSNPLEWWTANKQIYPCLSRMVLSYLSIPGESSINLTCFLFNLLLAFFIATSVDVEHVFSKGRLVLSYIRNCLSVESTQALLCLGAWIKLDLISKEDIQTAANLPDIKKGEEEVEDEFDTVL